MERRRLPHPTFARVVVETERVGWWRNARTGPHAGREAALRPGAVELPAWAGENVVVAPYLEEDAAVRRKRAHIEPSPALGVQRSTDVAQTDVNTSGAARHRFAKSTRYIVGEPRSHEPAAGTQLFDEHAPNMATEVTSAPTANIRMRTRRLTATQEGILAV